MSREGSEKGKEGHNNRIHSQFSVLTLISVNVPTPCYRSSTEKIPVILPAVQVAGYS